jgi:hypothetical protein
MQKDEDLRKVISDAEKLLDELDDTIQMNPTDTIDSEASKNHTSNYQISRGNYKQDSKQFPLLIILGASLLVSILLASVFTQSAFITFSPSGKKRIGSGSAVSTNNVVGGFRGESSGNTGSSSELNDTASDEVKVYFKGIDLPITNKLCNKKGNFCIIGLANLVQNETGSASYNFQDTSNGQSTLINGTITISNLEKGSDGTRNFTFAFRDDQSSTTPGFAAAGYFNLQQDVAQAGIKTNFKTTESYGPKTPVGLENIAYLFPSS